MDPRRPHRAAGRAGAFHRPVPRAGRADADRGRRPGRLQLREGRHQDRRRRRLRRCLEARPLRLGIQEGPRQPRPRLSAASALFGGAGKPAAAGRLRHRALRIHTNWTNTVQAKHEFTLEDLAHTGTRELLKQRLPPSRAAASRTRPASRSPRKRPTSSPTSPSACAWRATRRTRSRISSTASSSACSPRTWTCCRTTCSSACSTRWRSAATRCPSVADDAVRAVRQHARRAANFGLDHILHFNGGLFDDDEALPLDADVARHPAPASRGRTGRRSTRRSSARCSSAASTPTSARSSARTTPTATRS